MRARRQSDPLSGVGELLAVEEGGSDHRETRRCAQLRPGGPSSRADLDHEISDRAGSVVQLEEAARTGSHTEAGDLTPTRAALEEREYARLAEGDRERRRNDRVHMRAPATSRSRAESLFRAEVGKGHLENIRRSSDQRPIVAPRSTMRVPGPSA